jgi:hypothetical protein
VYDSPGAFSTTRPLLLKRVPVDWAPYYQLLLQTATEYAGELPSSGMPDMGDPGRWLLPQDEQGLHDLGHTLEDLSALEQLQVCSGLVADASLVE